MTEGCDAADRGDVEGARELLPSLVGRDPAALDASGIAAATRELAREASRLQTGYVYHYAFAMLIGVVALITWYLLPR